MNAAIIKSIKIDKGIKMQEHPRGKSKVLYPFPNMEVGDSFFIPLPEDKRAQVMQSQLISNARSWCLRNQKTWRFKSKGVDGGVRIWRVQ